MGFPGVSVIKNRLANAGDIRDAGLILRLGRSLGGRNGNSIQYSCLGNSMDRGPCEGQVRAPGGRAL